MAKPLPDNATLAELQRQINGMPQEAVPQQLQNLDEILKGDAKNPQHWFVMGMLLNRVGLAHQALDALQNAHKYHKTSDIILGTLAFICAERLKDHDAALKYLQKKHSLNRNDPQTIFLMANCQMEMGNPDQALELLDKAASLVTNPAKIHALRAQCYVRMGNSQAARENYEKVQELDPQAAFAMVDKLAMLPDNTKEQLEGLKSQLEDVLVNKPEKFRTKEHRVASQVAVGNICEKLEQYDQAFDNFKAANELQKMFAIQTDWEKSFELLQGAFDAETLGSISAEGHSSTEQIFIVGMVRSGTTLVESIPRRLGGSEGFRRTGIHVSRTSHVRDRRDFRPFKGCHCGSAQGSTVAGSTGRLFRNWQSLYPAAQFPKAAGHNEN